MALTQEEFINRCNEIHEQYYDYSCTLYKKVSECVEIICPLHGKFTQRARDHLMGKGCAPCGTARMAQRNQQRAASKFLDEVSRLPAHAGKGYCYDKTIYKNSKEKVVVTCLAHGDFHITPQNHLNGRGCKKCWVERKTKKTFKLTSEAVLLELEKGFIPNKPANLYILKCRNLIKVGISNNDVRYRCESVSKTSGFDFKVRTVYVFDSGRIAQIIETEVLRLLRKTYEQPTEKFDGYTETFLNVDMSHLLLSIEQFVAVIERAA